MEVLLLKIYVGLVKFIQQFEPGYGDYTAEKYNMPDITADEIEALLVPSALE